MAGFPTSATDTLGPGPDWVSVASATSPTGFVYTRPTGTSEGGGGDPDGYLFNRTIVHDTATTLALTEAQKTAEVWLAATGAEVSLDANAVTDDYAIALVNNTAETRTLTLTNFISAWIRDGSLPIRDLNPTVEIPPNSSLIISVTYYLAQPFLTGHFLGGAGSPTEAETELPGHGLVAAAELKPIGGTRAKTYTVIDDTLAPSEANYASFAAILLEVVDANHVRIATMGDVFELPASLIAGDPAAEITADNDRIYFWDNSSGTGGQYVKDRPTDSDDSQAEVIYLLGQTDADPTIWRAEVIGPQKSIACPQLTIFAPASTVGAAGRIPTEGEIETWATSFAVRDTWVTYNGTDTEANDKTAIFRVDIGGNATQVYQENDSYLRREKVTHDLATALPITWEHLTKEVLLLGLGGASFDATAVDDSFVCVVTNGTGAPLTLSVANAIGTYLRDGSDLIDLDETVTLAKNASYVLTRYTYSSAVFVELTHAPGGGAEVQFDNVVEMASTGETLTSDRAYVLKGYSSPATGGHGGMIYRSTGRPADINDSPHQPGPGADDWFERLDAVYELNIADFGAVGDGVTDDYAAILKCIDYAVSLGGDVLIRSHHNNKNYMLSTGFLLTNEHDGLIFDFGNDWLTALPTYTGRSAVIFCQNNVNNSTMRVRIKSINIDCGWNFDQYLTDLQAWWDTESVNDTQPVVADDYVAQKQVITDAIGGVNTSGFSAYNGGGSQPKNFAVQIENIRVRNSQRSAVGLDSPINSTIGNIEVENIRVHGFVASVNDSDVNVMANGTAHSVHIGTLHAKRCNTICDFSTGVAAYKTTYDERAFATARIDYCRGREIQGRTKVHGPWNMSIGVFDAANVVPKHGRPAIDLAGSMTGPFSIDQCKIVNYAVGLRSDSSTAGPGFIVNDFRMYDQWTDSGFTTIPRAINGKGAYEKVKLVNCGYAIRTSGSQTRINFLQYTFVEGATVGKFRDSGQPAFEFYGRVYIDEFFVTNPGIAGQGNRFIQWRGSSAGSEVKWLRVISDTTTPTDGYYTGSLMYFFTDAGNVLPWRIGIMDGDALTGYWIDNSTSAIHTRIIGGPWDVTSNLSVFRPGTFPAAEIAIGDVRISAAGETGARGGAPDTGIWTRGSYRLTNSSNSPNLIGWRCEQSGDFDGTPPAFTRIETDRQVTLPDERVSLLRYRNINGSESETDKTSIVMGTTGSVAAWVRVPNVATNSHFFGAWNGSDERLHATIQSSTFRAGVGSDAPATITTTLILTNNTWHHCVLTWGTNGVNLYLDGVNDYTQPLVNGTITSVPVALGGRNDGTDVNLPLLGEMHHLQCWAYELSPDDVQLLYKRTDIR